MDGSSLRSASAPAALRLSARYDMMRLPRRSAFRASASSTVLLSCPSRCLCVRTSFQTGKISDAKSYSLTCRSP